MPDLQKTIDRCKKSISDGEPIYDYKFYYDVIELLAEKKPIEPCKEAPTVSGWISVKDRMPPNDDTKVLTYGNPVTHWMPLPEPPKEGETNES